MWVRLTIGIESASGKVEYICTQEIEWKAQSIFQLVFKRFGHFFFLAILDLLE